MKLEDAEEIARILSACKIIQDDIDKVNRGYGTICLALPNMTTLPISVEPLDIKDILENKLNTYKEKLRALGVEV